ncbi:hypothetical protein GCM10010448_01320 [Streptomyces glomeratus]|uniref:Uncharacterized protein n=1 Tax=Streptomyces glomeratus TaxID=284452 RepID=A0ABN3YDT5_9ACTN
MLAEDPLDGDDFRPVRVEPLLDALFDGDEAVAQVGVHGRADDTDGEHRQRPAGHALDDTDAAPGQSRVHPQYAHPRASLRSLPATAGRYPRFVQAIGCH